MIVWVFALLLLKRSAALAFRKIAEINQRLSVLVTKIKFLGVLAKIIRKSRCVILLSREEILFMEDWE